MRDSGICICFGYGSSLTGITVTSRRSLVFPEFGTPSWVFVALPDVITFLLPVDDDVLALAFADARLPIVLEGFPG